MTSIIIYTTEETLNHKKGLKEGEESCTFFYWEFSKMPKRIDGKDLIFFATKKFIRGYFLIEDLDDYSVEWSCESWIDIKPIPTKSFQGFKYADKVKELSQSSGEKKE